MVLKWPIRPEVPSLNFVLSQNPYPAFCHNQKGYEMQKVARVKEARKKRGKGQEKSLKQAMAKNSPNFGLCACTKLKYSTFLRLISGKSFSLVENSFFSETVAHLRPWQLKNWFRVKKGIYLVHLYYSKG